ncbi:group II truncated hemoglobin [Planctobacterium marinum]|uniref:Globin n=1 Tax=Planctobacterium marinum TaxID=1631968 RepID=A0AA48HMQ4_9ALTE|nr:globin [Planctobacterium marinum]
MLDKLFKKKPKSAYEAIGGEQGTQKLANTFYDIMETDEFAAELLALHPKPMDSIRQKFFEYLSGWLGGPPLYEAQYGHPRLRARHLPFEVSDNMVEQWLYCMNKALNEVVEDDNAREAIRQPITQLARHMKNS